MATFSAGLTIGIIVGLFIASYLVKLGKMSNKKKYNSDQKSNGSNSRSYYSLKGSNFRFQLQDSTNKRTYTFEKIRYAIILRI